MSSRPYLRVVAVLLLAGCGSAILYSCGEAEATLQPVAPGAATSQPTPRVAVTPTTARLLEVAFDAASALPLRPHTKTRALLQESVGVAWLELHQPERALAAFDEITDWRRGAGYADYAYYCVENGLPIEQAEQRLQLAAKIADEVMSGPDAQAWRRDRVRAKIARVRAMLGEHEAADQLTRGLEDSEVALLAATRARQIEADDIEKRLVAFDALLKAGSFDQVRGVLETCAVLFDRFYDDVERRDEFERRVVTSYVKLPTSIRIDLLAQLTESALRHDAKEHAEKLLESAHELLAAGRWSLEEHVPMHARMAELWHRLGDAERARRELATAHQKYVDQRDSVPDIYHADALRPIAAAWFACGDTQRSLQHYRATIEAGRQNPNSRPRAEDLVATCVSMAVHGVEPDAETLELVQQAYAELGNPW